MNCGIDPPSEVPAKRGQPAWFLGLLAVIMANLIWASSYSANAVTLTVLSPALFTSLRLGIATAVLLPFMRWPREVKWDRGLTWQAIWLGCVGFTIPMWLQLAGQAATNAAMAALSVSLEPLLTVALGVLLAGQHLPRRGWVALVLAAVGAWIVAGFPRAGVGAGPGDLLLGLSVLCYATYTVTSQRYSRKLPPLTATGLVMAVGFLTSLPLWWVSGHSWPEVWPDRVVGGLVYVALLGTAGAYWLWMVGLRRAPIAVAAFSLYLQPLLGVGFAMLFLSLRPPWSFYLGAGFIALALFVLRPDRIMAHDQSLEGS